MKYKILLTSTAIYAVCLSALAAVPCEWSATPQRPAPAQFDRFHGESLDFRCTFTGFGSLPFDGASDVRLWYQTNGMGAAWWSLPATVSSNILTATFPPSADPGAERLIIFFGAPSNAYAAAQVRFRNSPGATPNSLPPPSVLDWKSSLAAATNELYKSLAPKIADIISGDQGVGYAAEAESATDARRAEYAEVSARLGDPSINRDAETIFAQLDEAATTNDVRSIVTNETAGTFSEWTYSDLSDEGIEIIDQPVYQNGYWGVDFIAGGPEWASAVGLEDATRLAFSGNGYSFTATRTYTPGKNALGLARLSDIPTNHVTHAELEAAINSIPEVDTSNLATKGELSPILSSVNSMWATLYGENVWFAITNYMRQVANTVPSLRLWEVRDSQTNMVYSSAEEIEHVVTQKVNAAKSEIKGMIPRTAWGSYQSSGEDNPSSNAVTVVNSSKIMLTGGGEWYRTVETGGRAIWVLKTNGMMTLGGDTNGYFKVCDAEGNAQIEVVKTADQVVGAFAPDHDFDGDGNFTVTFNASGSEHPKASCAVDLGDDFEEEDDGGNINSLGITVEWAKNGGGMWVATIHQDTPAPRLFVYGKRKISGENLVRNNAPTALDGGIYINNVKYRLVPYSTGGKTYMTLEAWQ